MKKMKTIFFILSICLITFFCFLFFISNEVLANTKEVKYTLENGLTQEGMFNDAINNVNDGGQIELLSDITIDSLITIDKNITITGNNKFSIKRGAAQGYLFNITKNTLTFKNIVIDGGSKNNTTALRGIFAVSSGNLIMAENSHIINNKNIQNNGAGGAVALIGGSMTMNESSTIENCQVSSGMAGGIMVVNEESKLTINGGKIKNCTALIGAAITVQSGTFDFLDGELSYNTATGTYGNQGGGAIYEINNSGSTNLKGGIISNNTAANFGGAILINSDGIVNIEGTTITNNTASYGGGIFALHSVLNISKTKITNNTANNQHGGGIYQTQYCQLSLSGDITIKDNISNASSNTPITNNLLLAGAETLPTKPLIMSNSLSDNSYIGVTPFILPDENNPHRIFIVPRDIYSITENDLEKIYCDNPLYTAIIYEKNIALVQKILVEKLELNPKELNLTVGDTYQFKITIFPENANEKLIWSSSNEEIVFVDENGKITALKEGTSIITVTSKITNISCSSTITVTAPEDDSTENDNQDIQINLELNPKELNLTVGDTYQFKITTFPENANEELIWSSSNQEIVSVDKNGKVTALKEGTSIITVTIKTTNISCSSTITVTAPKDYSTKNDNQDIQIDNYKEQITTSDTSKNTSTDTGSNTEDDKTTGNNPKCDIIILFVILLVIFAMGIIITTRVKKHTNK